MSRYSRQQDFEDLQTAGTKLTGEHLDSEFDAVLEAVNNVDGTQLSEGSVSTSHIEDGAATEDKIADGSITNQKLAAASITSNKAVVYESADTSIANGTTQAFTHGLVDEDGAARAPKIVLAYVKDSVTGRYGPSEQITYDVSTTVVNVKNATGGSKTVKVTAF